MRIKNLLKILIIILCVLLISFFIGKLEEKNIETFWEKTDLIKIGMSEEEVIQILGNPYIEGWIESKEAEKVKRYYVLVYVPLIVKVKLFKSTWPWYEIYLDKKGGKVVWKPLVIPLYSR